MRRFLVVGAAVLSFAMPLGAAEFLGIDLCQDHMETSVVLPEGSPLSIVSVEVGKYGALVIQFEGDGKEALGQVDDLMLEAIGARGVGDNESLQWSGRSLTAFAEVIKKGFVALAVSSEDSCRQEPLLGEAPQETVSSETESGGQPVEEDVVVVEVASAVDEYETVAGPVVAGSAVDQTAGAETVVESEDHVESEDFTVRGDIAHMKAADAWVDVMGVVHNSSGQGYRIATFDLSFYDASGALMCVDTISVSVLKDGQERAFRDSIQCPGYDASQVARTVMQFAGGY